MIKVCIFSLFQTFTFLFLLNATRGIFELKWASYSKKFGALENLYLLLRRSNRSDPILPRSPGVRGTMGVIKKGETLENEIKVIPGVLKNEATSTGEYFWLRK